MADLSQDNNVVEIALRREADLRRQLVERTKQRDSAQDRERRQKRRADGLEGVIRRAARDLERTADSEDPYYANDVIGNLRAALKGEQHG